MRCFLPRRCGFPRAGLKIRAFKTAGYSTASRALNRALRVWGKVFLRDWHVGVQVKIRIEELRDVGWVL